MILEKIFNRLREQFGQSDKNQKDWLDIRVNEIETLRQNFENLPFKIIEIKDAGFLVKVNGVFAYISIYHKPWKYPNKESWIAIAPSLIGKTLFCKVHQLVRDPLFILLNGEIAQFKKAELTVGEEYKGLITEIKDYGLFIDIGYHFEWKCGSLYGLLHKSQLDKLEKTDDFQTGQEITIIYQGINENGQPVFSHNREIMEWQLNGPQELFGQKAWAEVILTPDTKRVEVLVRGKYRAILVKDNKSHSSGYRRRYNRAKRELKNGEIINCEVTGYSKKDRSLRVNWLIDIEEDIIIENTISNTLDSATLQKLATFKDSM
jgi:ribosomal protein S1